MPDKPSWLGKLPELIAAFEALDFPWVDSGMLRTALDVSPRRAQQIIQPLIRHFIGRNGVAHRDDVVDHLKRLAGGDAAHYERRRRERLEAILAEAKATPRVLVEAPVSAQDADIDGLPEGVSLAPGRISISFSDAQQALEKMLSLAMAIGNDMGRFERLTTQESQKDI